MGKFLQYEYTFPVKKVKGEPMPKYDVQQQKNEEINWSWDDKQSVYRTNKKHPELKKLEDVEFRELSDKITKEQLDGLPVARLRDFAKTTYKIDTKKHSTKDAVIKEILKKQK